MTLETRPIAVNDFSGGMVDEYINAPPNRAQTLDNLIVFEDKSALMRPGSEVDDLVNPLIPSGNNPIRTLINYDDDDALLIQSAKRIYYRNPSAYTSLVGPSSNDPFDLGDANSIVSHAQWQGHLLVTNNDFAKPTKIYRDSAGVLQCRTAGLPVLGNGTTPSSPTVTPFAAGTKAYIYAFHFAYVYTVGDETFEDLGPITEVLKNSSSEPSPGTPTSITSIPVLANGSTRNWHTTGTGRVKIYIFRTVDAGTTLYKVGEVENGTTSFSDTVTDALLQDNETIYTDGGLVENDEPPLAKFVHIVQNKAYYAYLKEGTEILTSDVMQSLADDIDSVPADNRDRVEDDIHGLSSVREIPIVLGSKKIYRIDGEFDDQGNGFMSHVRIHDSAGCVSHNSCVQAEQGLYWAGNDGFYYTDGHKCFKVSDNINTSYKNFIDAMKETGDLERITGRFDEKNRRIIWSVQRDGASLENDACFEVDLRYGISTEMPFHTWSGTETNFRPTALEFFNGNLYRGDSRGYVFIHSHDFATDPKVDTSLDADEWQRSTVIYTYRSIASNLGSDFVRKWVPRIEFLARNRSNLSVQINVINDDGKLIRPLAQIRYRNNFLWGDPDFLWGQTTCTWNALGLIEEWRRMPAKGLRVSFIQVEITNAYTVIANSDTLGTATIAPGPNTALLDDAVNSDWPLDSVDYFLSFESDDYETQYLVTSRSADTLVFADPGATAPSGSVKWLLKGYKKDEVLNLLSYTLHVAPLSKTQTNLAGVNTGANA